MILLKYFTQYVSKYGKLNSGHRTGKGQFSFQSQGQFSFQFHSKKGNAKECSNYWTIALISHTSKVMLKILQARLQQCMNWELQMFKLDLEKAEEPKSKLPTSGGSWKKQESSRKTSASLTMLKPLTVWITVNCRKFWDGNTRPPYLSPEKSVCTSRSNS